MGVTLAASPAVPHVGETVALAVATDEPRSLAVRWDVVAVPSRSALPLGTLQDARGTWTAALTTDAPGTYLLDAGLYEQRHGDAARYPGDPAADAGRTLLAVKRFPLRVAEVLELPIATARGGAVLALSVVDLPRDPGDALDEPSAVVAARWRAPTSERARLAILGPEVVATSAALVGTRVPSLDVVLVDGVETLRAAYEAHRATTRGEGDGLVHRRADETNAVRAGRPYSLAAALALLAELRTALAGHLAAAGTEAPHAEPDTRNVPLALPDADLAAAFVQSVDLRHRVFARHLEQTSEPTCHGTSDTTHGVGSAMPLAAAVVAFLDALAGDVLTLPATEPQGAALAELRFGFAPSRRE